uniref:Sec-independent protein translocase component TatC n=1 Tax=Nitzschia sp. PL1-4 TaxID=2083272 RepID=A0A2Z5ZAB9_9STRA|nr:Sec-independent protein translocase component TatC [Nitzschia sp. PL1-4]
MLNLFNFIKNYKKKLKVSFLEHNKELFLRVLLTILFYSFVFFYIFNKSNFILKLITRINFDKKIEFFQNFPIDFFYSKLRVSILTCLFILYPIILYQIILFFFPNYLKRYFRKIILYLNFSFIAFNIGIFFAYSIIIPNILKFFLNYNKEIISPFWFLEYYINFVYYFFFITGILFQIPLILVIFKELEIISIKKIILKWKPLCLIINILSAIITPSTDIGTQLIVSLIFLILYLFGILLSSLII